MWLIKEKHWMGHRHSQIEWRVTNTFIKSVRWCPEEKGEAYFCCVANPGLCIHAPPHGRFHTAPPITRLTPVLIIMCSRIFWALWQQLTHEAVHSHTHTPLWWCTCQRSFINDLNLSHQRWCLRMNGPYRLVRIRLGLCPSALEPNVQCDIGAHNHSEVKM